MWLHLSSNVIVKQDLRPVHTCKNKKFVHAPRFESFSQLVPDIVWTKLFSRVVSENCDVICQKF